MGILLWLYCNQDFPIKHTCILYPISNPTNPCAASQFFFLHLPHLFHNKMKGECWKPAVSVLQRRPRCWHVWITAVSVHKIIFYKDRKTTPAPLTFPNTARILQNPACPEWDPKFHVLCWFYNWLYSQSQYLETCKTNFFNWLVSPDSCCLQPPTFQWVMTAWWRMAQQLRSFVSTLWAAIQNFPILHFFHTVNHYWEESVSALNC